MLLIHTFCLLGSKISQDAIQVAAIDVLRNTCKFCGAKASGDCVTQIGCEALGIGDRITQFLECRICVIAGCTHVR